MNDITKARYYLTNRNSKLTTFTSFSLMLATAEANYKNIKLRQRTNMDPVGTWDEQEVEASLDYAVLTYLKKHNQLPKNIGKAFQTDVSLEDKKRLAQEWFNA